MRFRSVALLALASMALSACSDSDSGGGGGTAFLVGGPIAGLTQAELDAFERGRVVFSRRFHPSEGLGPYYNATSCADCHSTPAPGGSAPRYRNFYIAGQGLPGSQVPFSDLGLIGQLPQPGTPPSMVIPSFATQGGARPRIPATGDPFLFGAPIAVGQRNAISTFGAGLFEAVSDLDIMANADPDDSNADGISGRFNTDDTTIGRLGVKSQSNNVEVFSRGPLNNQMGITTDPFDGTNSIASLGVGHTAGLRQQGASFDTPTTDLDAVPDPEMSSQDLGDLIAFARFLAPPAKKAFSAAATRGEALFDSIGCALCHIPSLPSSRGPVEAYTDLLIHDMGPGLADGLSFGDPQNSTIDGNTTENEFRTQPLWGVSMHAPFLHDGRADTLTDAIMWHGGEAQAIRLAFDALPQTDKDDIIAFLEAL